MDAFLSFISSRIFVIPNICCTDAIPIKNTILQEIRRKVAEKAFLVKTKKNMLLQAMTIL